MFDKFVLKDLNNENKPRERLLLKGPEALSDAELLAIVLRAGGQNKSVLEVSFQLLKNYQSLKNILEADVKQLTKQKYIGNVKAITIKAVSEIAKRAYFTKEQPNILIKTPQIVFNLIKKDLYGKKQEQLLLICLDTRKRLIKKELISLGSINETLIPVREIIQKALANNAVNIILAHNHPSGDPKPSKEDILITERVGKACKVVGLNLLDHLITADEKYISIKSLDLFESN